MSDQEQEQEQEQPTEVEQVKEEVEVEKIAEEPQASASGQPVIIPDALFCLACNSKQDLRTSIHQLFWFKDVKQYCKRCNVMLNHAKQPKE